MQIHLARNGENIGKFTIEELKLMALRKEIQATDHAYLPDKGAWVTIAENPELNNQLFQVSSEPVTSSNAVYGSPKNSEQLINGYPREFWQATFQNKTDHFLEKFKGFRTPAEAKIAEEEYEKYKSSITSPKEAAKENLKQTFEITSLTRNIRICYPALILGWGYLAYRKATSYAVVFYLFCLGAIYAFRQYVIHAKGSNTQEGYEANMLLVVLAMALLFWLIPVLFSHYFVFQNAVADYESVCKRQTNKQVQIDILKKKGGTSILRVIAFNIFAFIANSLILLK